MNFDLIVIGNELLNGKIQDQNTHFLAKIIHEYGHILRKVHIIGDTESEFKDALIAATKSSDIVMTTGGLGPTKDDLTKKMLAQFLKKEIVFNQSALDITKAHYLRGQREFNVEKSDYQNIPKGFSAISNPIGYAPALHYKSDNFQIFSLPGVPSEFQAIIKNEIFKKLIIRSNIHTKHITIKTWKTPESKIFNTLCPGLWEQLESFGEVSSLPQRLGVNIGVKISADSEVLIEEKENKIIKLIQGTELKDYIWNIGPESIEEIIVKKATAKKLTIGFAESCTGGLCASRITDISGSSAVFWGSIVSYSNEVKQKSLSVSAKTLQSHGAVSKETALEMAIGAKDQLVVDIAVSTTGIAGPGGATPGKPVGTVGIGISSKNGSSSEVHQFLGERVFLKQYFSEAALMKLLEEINSL